MEFVDLTGRFLHRVFVPLAVVFLLGSLKESSAQITFTEEPQDTKVIAGNPVSLNCTATSLVSLKYAWQFNGAKMYSDDRKTIKKDGTLEFKKTEVKDDGEYVCVARLTDGSKTRKKSRKALLTIQSICSASTIATIPDRDQHTTDAQIEMTCKCSNSKPSPTITWFKDGSKLANGGRVSISSNKLVISKLQIADSGNYQCNASNFLGTKESPVKTIQVLNAVRPVFEPKPLSKIFAKKGEDVKIECKATGKPPPTIKWFYGTQSDALSNSSKHTLGSDGSLTIVNVDDNDFEYYKCEASNFLSSIAAETEIKKAYIDSFSFDRMGGKVQYAEIGEAFTVYCTPSGGPKPTITWKTLKGGPLPPSFVANNEELKNMNVKQSDSANFTCEAKNIAGTKSANLQVIAAVLPYFTDSGHPRPTAANENSKTKLECSVTTTLPVTVTWYKNGKEVILDSYHKKNSKNALVFKKVSEKDKGVYQCIVKTAAKRVWSRTANLTVNAAVSLSNYNMNHHKFNMGTEARIYCTFKGAGPIAVTWRKKGTTALGKNVIPQGEKLTIKNIGMDDEGIYVCTGSNSFSNVSASVSVSVFIYPKFVVKPNNITAEEFGSFWVHCNATGYPKPKITFSKEALGGDNLPPRFHQFENGSMYIEKILPEDKGNYYCIAANAANLNQVTFSVRVIVPPEVKADSKESTMGRTIAIAVGCAAAYIVLVVGLMIYCKRRRAKQQKREQLNMDGDAEHCEADPEMPLQPVNGKPANYNKMEFPRHDLEALRTLGNGSYGRAFLSRASGIKDGERETMVVVKSLMSTDEIQKEDFWRELNALVKMDNPHVMTLLGVCRDIAPQYMIFEYLEKGDLKQYLLSCYDNGRSTLTSSQKLSLCSNIVSGMTYLSSNNFVHKDLAARNCMVTKDLQVKIGFLSLSYDLYSSEYYRFNNMLIPLRWMAPEAVFNDEFSEKSDVWSYGVLVWEVYTLGQTPFDDRPDEEVLKCIKEDLRLSKPDNCPDTMANVMKKCWDSNLEDRPSFEKLYAEISEIAVDTKL